jgi:hypothetical protein
LRKTDNSFSLVGQLLDMDRATPPTSRPWTSQCLVLIDSMSTQRFYPSPWAKSPTAELLTPPSNHVHADKSRAPSSQQSRMTGGRACLRRAMVPPGPARRPGR